MLATWSSDNTAGNYLHTPHFTPGSDAAQSSVPAAVNIEAQFEQFMLQSGNIRPLVRRRAGEVRFEDSEQSYARRRLLEIEKITLKSKQRHAQSSASLVDKWWLSPPNAYDRRHLYHCYYGTLQQHLGSH